MHGLADGTLKVVVSVDTEAECHAAVGREIRAAKKEGFAESDIAIVSLRGLLYPGNLAHSRTLGRCELAKATDLDHRDRVICDTFLRYKGLEAHGHRRRRADGGLALSGPDEHRGQPGFWRLEDRGLAARDREGPDTQTDRRAPESDVLEELPYGVMIPSQDEFDLVIFARYGGTLRTGRRKA